MKFLLTRRDGYFQVNLIKIKHDFMFICLAKAHQLIAHTHNQKSLNQNFDLNHLLKTEREIHLIG